MNVPSIRIAVALLLALTLVAAGCADDDLEAGDDRIAALDDLTDDDLFDVIDGLDDDAYFDLLDFAGTDDVEDVLADRNPEVLAFLLDLLGGDPGASDQPASVTTTSPGSATGTNGGAAAQADDVRRIEFGSLGDGDTVAVEVRSGDLSFLVFATAGFDDQVFITEVLSPSGEDVGDALGLDYGELSNFGEAAFYAPVRDEVALEPGEYLVSFESTGSITEAAALIRSGDERDTMAIDVVFWLATNEPYDPSELDARFREVGDTLFRGHGITVGEMTFVTPPAAIVDRYATIDLPDSDPTDAALRELCREMSRETGGLRALNFAIVDEITGGGADFVIEGSAAGLPGTVMLPGSGTSCVAAMAIPDPEDPDRDLLARATVIWHEAGHLLGLYHTTESEGDFFDLLDDTPECPAGRFDDDGDGLVDAFECPDGDNFMFHDSDGLDMTDDQAWMVRRHPLLYPVG